MVDFYTEMQGIASEFIREFDMGEIYYVGLTPGGGPPDNPGEPTETTTLIPAVARGVQFKYIDNTNIVASDGQIRMPADLGIVPSIEGYIRIGTTRHRIVQASAIPPAGVPVAYMIIFKR